MQRRFFKSSDLHDLFSLNEGTSDKTESSAIFAGTNSEVRPKKRSGKSNLTDSREKSEKVYSVKIERPKLKDNSKLINKLIGRDDQKSEKERKEETAATTEREERRSDLDDEERKKILEKVRQINLKFQQKSISPSTSKFDDRKRKKGAKFEGKVRVSHLDKCRAYVPAANPDDEKPETDKKQNDYVLSRLFKKSGVHSALQVSKFNPIFLLGGISMNAFSDLTVSVQENVNS